MNYKDISVIQGNAYDLIKSISDNSIDLIVTDPPYLYDKKGNGKNIQYNALLVLKKKKNILRFVKKDLTV